MASKFIECMAEQIFKTGFIHADPHPGNGKIDVVEILFIKRRYAVLIRAKPGSKKREAEIILLDHGLYMYVEPRLVVTLHHSQIRDTYFFACVDIGKRCVIYGRVLSCTTRRV